MLFEHLKPFFLSQFELGKGIVCDPEVNACCSIVWIYYLGLIKLMYGLINIPLVPVSHPDLHSCINQIRPEVQGPGVFRQRLIKETQFMIYLPCIKVEIGKLAFHK